jgi:hypothetical protein
MLIIRREHLTIHSAHVPRSFHAQRHMLAELESMA